MDLIRTHVLGDAFKLAAFRGKDKACPCLYLQECNRKTFYWTLQPKSHSRLQCES